MAERNWKNRTLYRRDNLDVLRGMNSETVDLIATDPPFNKGKDFHATPESLAAGAKFQDRWSWDDDVHQEWVDQIADDWPRVRASIDAARMTHSDGMDAFLCYIGVRLIEMRRVLKPTGSLYLHCDPTASHYLKWLLDAVFGHDNFRNEVVWCYKKWSNALRGFQKNHDIILFYTKSDSFSFNKLFGEMTESMRQIRQRGYNGGSSKGKRILRVYDANNPKAIKKIESGDYDEVYYVDEPASGAPLPDYWDLSYLSSASKERIGYPTQKPLALYERIIKASSNAGDIVFDPFCGCATTLVAAERLGRQWVGADIWDGAKAVVRTRLQREGIVREGDNLEKNQTEPIFREELTYIEGVPQRDDDWRESVPFLPSKLKQREPPGPRMSRAEMVEILIERDGIRCQGCFRKFDHPSYLELDHKLPRADGGLNHIENRILLCGPCNRTKSHRLTLSGLREKNQQTGFTVQR